MKHDGEHDWLNDAGSQVLQQKLMDLNKAYVNFFEKRAKYPALKKKRHTQKIRYPQRLELKASQGVIFLPKLGDVLMVYHRPIEVWYNRQRLHSSLGYLTPEEFERQVLDNTRVR